VEAFLNEYIADIVWVGGSLLILTVYHFYLGACLRNNPHCTIQGVNREARHAWVVNIMGDPAIAIVGVQTLRNATMAATFLASTAVLLMMGVLNLSGEADKFASSWHLLNFIGSHHPGLWLVKLLLLMADLFVAFFSFAMSVRLYNHVGFYLSIPQHLRPSTLTPEHVAAHLIRAGYYYSIGMRVYYLAVPFVFWLFGPHLMALATVIIVVVLYHVDHIPDFPDQEPSPTAAPAYRARNGRT
jgi:uncharacterized membrane protein